MELFSIRIQRTFQLVSTCDEDNQYRYGFEADNSSVHSEWLYQKAH